MTGDELTVLLPAHLRTRDEAAGGLLHALLAVVANELDRLDEDLADLYRSWFVETCPEWVVPYLADLVGVVDLPPETAGVSRRAFVANTIGYRRRKGTVAVIEQVARDASGWPAKAVEFYRLLATSAHLNHVRPDRPATASLRRAEPLDLGPATVAYGALDPLAHTGEVRHIASGRGRYQIPHVGIFLFPHQVYDFPLAAQDDDWPEAVRETTGPDALPDGTGWRVHPLGRPTPLFAPPTTEDTIEHLAVESDLPVPIRPRRLLDQIRRARTDPGLVPGLPVGVQVDGATLEPVRIRVCGCEDLAPVDGWQVMIDPTEGWLRTYRDGAPAVPGAVRVRHAYGALADLGAGTYDRAAVHEQATADQGFVGDGAADRPDVRAQVLVESDGVPSSVADALAGAETEWAEPIDSPAGGSYVVAVGDSSRYVGDLTVSVPPASRLVLVAATWRDRVVGRGEVLPRAIGEYSPEGLRPVVVGSLAITGASGAAVLLDGLVVTGDVVVEPGDLGWLTLSQCTIGGTVRVAALGEQANENCRLALVRTICRSVDLAATVPSLRIGDSVVDAGGEAAIRAPGAAVSVDGSTVRGSLAGRSLQAGNAILDGRALIEHRQIGCARFSYLGPGSKVPRRFACVPAAEGSAAPTPVYVSVEPGSPSYLALAAGGPQVLASGAEGDGEMGVYHHRRAALRVQATRRLLAPFVPVGLEIGIVGS